MPDRAKLEDLLQRVEAARGPDWEIDAEIYRAFGYRVEVFVGDRVVAFPPEGGPATPAKQHLTGSVDAALELAEKVLPRYRIGMAFDPDGYHRASCTSPGTGLLDMGPIGRAATLPLALVAALLRATLAKGAAE